MSNIDHTMIRQATERINNMNESDFRHMTEQIKTTDPDRIATMAEAFNQKKNYSNYDVFYFCIICISLNVIEIIVFEKRR